MKKIVIKLAFFLPLLGLIVFINVLIDPAGLFRAESFERNIAEALIQGKNITDFSIISEASLQKLYVDRLEEAPNVVVFGSSHTMGISSDVFPGKTLVNSSIPSATLDDIIGLYGLYYSRNLIPKRIVWGLDPHILSIKGADPIEENLKASYKIMVNQFSSSKGERNFRPSTIWDLRYLEIMSPRYIQASLKKFKMDGWKTQNKKNNSIFTITSKRYNETTTRLSDLSKTYKREIMEKTSEELIAENRKEACNFGYFVNFDRQKRKKFNDFINFMKRDGVEIIIFLPPWSPSRRICSDAKGYNVFQAAESYHKQLGKEHGIKVIGSYIDYGNYYQASDFMDSSHLRNDNIVKELFNSNGIW